MQDRITELLRVEAEIAGGNDTTMTAVHEIRQDGGDVIAAECWTDASGEVKRYEVRLPFSQFVHLALNTTAKERAAVDARADWRGVDAVPDAPVTHAPGESESAQAERWARLHFGEDDWHRLDAMQRARYVAAMLPLVREARAWQAEADRYRTQRDEAEGLNENERDTVARATAELAEASREIERLECDSYEPCSDGVEDEATFCVHCDLQPWKHRLDALMSREQARDLCLFVMAGPGWRDFVRASTARATPAPLTEAECVHCSAVLPDHSPICVVVSVARDEGFPTIAKAYERYASRGAVPDAVRPESSPAVQAAIRGLERVAPRPLGDDVRARDLSERPAEAVTTGKPWTPSVGDRVVTAERLAKLDMSLTKDNTGWREAWRRANATGEVAFPSQCHDGYWWVRHDDGTEAPYNRAEILPVPKEST